jgi:capsular exopolysaccharide synthesis family protein
MEGRIPINRHPRATFATRFFAQWHRCKKLLLAYWWIVLAVLVVSLGIQWLWLRHLPPSFVSAGQMIVNVKLSIPSENTYSEELDNFFGTQVALMQGDSVINRVKQRLRPANLEETPPVVKIQVTLVPKTSIFKLLAVGTDPRYTRAYLEATMEEYINLKRDLLGNASDAAKVNIHDELAQLALKLQKSKQDFLDFQSSNSIVFLQENGGNSAAAYLSTLSSQLAQDQSELQLLKTLTLDENLEHQQGIFMQPGPAPRTSSSDAGSSSANAAVTSSSNPSPVTGNSDSTPASLGIFEADYLKAKQQILLLKAQRDDQAQFLKPKHPDIIALNDEIASQEKLLEIFRNQSQEQLKNRQHTLEVQITDLEKQIGEWKLKALEASKKLADFDVLKENSRRLQTMYDQLLASMQTLDVDKGIGQESVTILEPATLAAPLPVSQAKHLVMAGLIGLVAGFGILMLIERLDDRPASFFELEALFDQPVLAQFPLLKAIDKKAGVPVLQLEDDRHMLVESYQNLRSALIYKDAPATHPRRIVITSASANDGKSMVSANFAITLAQSGARVLLVDADLRRGTLHKHFRVSAEPGLADVLSQQCNWFEAAVHTSIPNLFLLPAGACPPRPGSLFAVHTSKFLADIAGRFDYYLFDTTPVMAADDVSSLAPHVDGVIMVIRAGHTSSRIAQTALDLLEMRKVNVIGLVFNGVRTNGGEFYHYQDKNYYPGQSTV